MIPLETVGALRIPAGRRFGIIPRHRGVVVVFTIDREPDATEARHDYPAAITVHGHTMHCGTYCHGLASVDPASGSIQFESESKAAAFVGVIEKKRKRMKGHLSLRGPEGVECEKISITFSEP